MTEVITDTKTISIIVIQHGDCEIMNLTFPASIETGEPFNIMYDCKNNGVDDMCYGTVKDASNQYDHWEEQIASGSFKSVLVDFPDGITEDFNGTVEVGYIK